MVGGWSLSVDEIRPTRILLPTNYIVRPRLEKPPALPLPLEHVNYLQTDSASSAKNVKIQAADKYKATALAVIFGKW